MSSITVLHGIRHCLFPSCSQVFGVNPSVETIWNGHSCRFLKSLQSGLLEPPATNSVSSGDHAPRPNTRSQYCPSSTHISCSVPSGVELPSHALVCQLSRDRTQASSAEAPKTDIRKARGHTVRTFAADGSIFRSRHCPRQVGGPLLPNDSKLGKFVPGGVGNT